MGKREITNDMLDSRNLISDSECINKTYRISKNETLKIFSDFYISIHDKTNMRLEKRILSAKQNLYGIVTPTDGAYLNGKFVGCFEPYIDGITDTDRDNNLTRKERIDLYSYAREYLKLEKIVKSHPNIVIPDLLTCDNIYVKPDGELVLKDYDGMQVDDNEVFTISDSLNEAEIIKNPKYTSDNGIYTKELDIKSLVHWYFYSAFNINLSMVGVYNPQTGKKVTLDDIFNQIKLDDPDFMNKVWKIFSNKKNEYLGEDVLNLAEDYDMIMLYADDNRGIYLKQLVRK